MKNNAFLMLNLLSEVDAEWMLSFFQDASKEFGQKLVDQVVKVRSTLPNERFTKLEELYVIEGLGEKGTDLLLASINTEPKYAGMVKGRETFTFSIAPVIPKSHLGEMVLEGTGPDFKDKKERTYLLYYKPELNKETIHKVVKSLTGFVSSQNDSVFMIQALNNKFIVARLSAPGHIYNHGASLGSRFRIYDEKNPAYPNTANSNLTNSKMAVAFEHEHYIFSNQKGTLRFDSTSNKVIGESLNNGHVPTSDQYFDISGIIGKPQWASPNTYKSFTIMTHHASQSLPANDPREFIQLGTTTNQVLEGTGRQHFWQGKTSLRYVEVIEDVRIRAIENRSHTGVEKDNMYLQIDNGAVSTQYYANTATNLPQSAFFDMYVFYGCWDERANISCRVIFHAKTGSKGFLGVNTSDALTGNYGYVMEDALFSIENGTGNNNNNVFLKTNYGKYLKSWRNSVVATSTDPIDHEQWEIVFS
jgi:hypothetical protein